MSDHDVSSVAAAAANSVSDTFHKLPASQTSHAVGSGKSYFFNRQRSVRDILGGGKFADVLLWKDRSLAGGILAGATVTWFLLEWSGYSLLTLLSNVILFLVVILFVWANVATLLKRAAPPLPELALSEEFVTSTARSLRYELNKALAVVHDVALGKDVKLFLKVIVGLYVLSVIGGWASFLTLAYIGIVILFTVPVFYDKYEDEVDKYAKIVLDEAHKQYRKFDAVVLSKIPRATKPKKAD
eukprot:TRINITY_DN12164_c0_g1_i1.p1 TRINITY_DN12164_c0_g1~~TRINITY_DN12164_c0_g1_i1.p1  ORF type:complete len:242 (+),score=44.73 TRINITY_DN12164_c0_g1_i1:216-941(+)